MNLGWYANRLRSMEPAEVGHRLLEKMRKIVSRRRHQGWARYPGAPMRRVLPGLKETVLAADSEQRAAVARAAAAILDGRFSALGRDWPQRPAGHLFPAELWRLDPVTGRSWPDAETYCFNIDFRHDGSRGDVKYVWEINRLQFLPVLSAFWIQTGEARALAAIEAAIGSWHAANPPFGGVAWASGIEVALRAISLVIVLDLVGDRLTPEARDRAGQILAASAFWLPRFPSRFSSANNHLVAELAGQYLLDLALGTGSASDHSALQHELSLQILPDGSGAEQTPSYAAFTAELVLLCALAARQAGSPFSAASAQRLAAFADFIAWLGPLGFGDDDEGRVLTLGHEEAYPASVAAAINGFLSRPGQQRAAGDFRAMVFAPPTGPAAVPKGLRTFSHGGLTLWHGEMAGRQVELAFDHGPLGYLSIAAHGHADALSLNLVLDGLPVLVDPGTWLYGSGGLWRDWFRSTPAHNTLNLDGASQSVISGPFNWSHKASTTLLQQQDRADWSVDAEHDGYEQRYGVRHRRRVCKAGETIDIHDSLAGDEQEAELVFQLAPEITADIAGGAVTLRHEGRDVMIIELAQGEIGVACGGEMPGQGGWVSPRFGQRLPAPRLTWRGRVGPAGVTTRLRPIAAIATLRTNP